MTRRKNALLALLSFILAMPAPGHAQMSCQNVWQSTNETTPVADPRASSAPAEADGSSGATLKRLRSMISLGEKLSEGASNFMLAYLTHAPYIPMSKSSSPMRAGAVRTAKSFGAEALNLLSPVPGLRPTNAATRIFDDLIRNPKRELSDAERTLLVQQNALKTYELKQRFLLKHPALAFALKAGRRTLVFLLASAYLLSIEQTAEMSDNVMTIEEYLEKPDEVDGNPVVHLLIETVPLPHTALRIGRRVYSYGVHQMTAVPLRAYMMEPPPEPENSQANSTAASWAFVGRIVGSLKMQRNVRFVELKLTADESFKMQRELEMQMQKQYKNKTMINDCSTMIFRALQRHTPIRINPAIDPFPTTAGQYLGLLKRLGDERIGDAGLVVSDKANLPALLARNTYIAFLESNLMITSAVFNLPQRAYIDLWTGEEALQWWSEKNQQVVREWETAAAQEVREFLTADGYFDSQLARAAKNSTERERLLTRLDKAVDILVEPLEQEFVETLALGSLELKDIVKTQAKLTMIEKIRAEWRERIETLKRGTSPE